MKLYNLAAYFAAFFLIMLLIGECRQIDDLPHPGEPFDHPSAVPGHRDFDVPPPFDDNGRRMENAGKSFVPPPPVNWRENDAKGRMPPKHRIGQPNMRDIFAQKLAEDFLQSLSPDEKGKILRLQTENPAAFHKEVFQYMQRIREESFIHVEELRKSYFNAETVEEKSAQLKKMQEHLDMQMEKNFQRTEMFLDHSEEEIQKAQKRIAFFRKELETRKQNKKVLLEKALRDLTDPDFKFRKPVQKFFDRESKRMNPEQVKER